MNVDFIGFALDVPEPITLDKLMAVLSVRSGRSYPAGDHVRRMYIDSTSNEEFYLGLVVTAKNQKTFVELEGEKDFKFRVRDVSSRSKLMEFNYFIICKKSRNGLYQRYANSCSVGAMCDKLWKTHSAIRQVTARQEIKQLPRDKKDIKNIRVVNAKYRPPLKWQMLTTSQKKMQQLIKELDSISNFSMEFAYLESENDELKGLEDYVNKERKRFSFKRGVLPSVVAGKITNTFKKTDGVRNGSVSGYQSGEKKVIKLYNNAELFEQFDFDYVTKKMNHKEVDDLNGSWVIEQLLLTASNYKSLFGFKVK